MEKVVKVCVGSANKAKIRAVQAGFLTAYAAYLRHEHPGCAVEQREAEIGVAGGETVRFVFEGVAVPSGVSEQPRGSRETLDGALNRLRGVTESAAFAGADYAVAIEGGITDEVLGRWRGVAWIAACGRDGARASVAETASFALPAMVVERVVGAGEELGPACDSVYSVHNTKEHLGAVGHMSFGAVPRDALYVPAVVLAVSPLLDTLVKYDFVPLK